MHYQRTLRPKSPTLTCIVCGGEFPRPYRSRSQVCSDECRLQRERDLRNASDAAGRDRGKCADCGKPLDSHAAIGRCVRCYGAYRRANPDGYECEVGGCDAPRVGGGLCSTHYNRDVKGLPLTLDPRECPGCGVVFTPTRDYQTHHNVACNKRDEARRRLGIPERPRVRACWWCDKAFDGRDYRRNSCAGECTRITKSLYDLQARYGITRDDYKAMWRRQGGVCASCREPTKGKRAKRLFIDHDHTCCPGQHSCGLCVRGLLCGDCNSMFGHARDSVQRLESGIAYLKQPPGPPSAWPPETT